MMVQQQLTPMQLLLDHPLKRMWMRAFNTVAGLRRAYVLERAAMCLGGADALNHESVQAVRDFLAQPYKSDEPEGPTRFDMIEAGPGQCMGVMQDLDRMIEDMTGKKVIWPIGRPPNSAKYKKGQDVYGANGFNF